MHYIRSKIDYGCIVHGSASETALKHLDVVVNDAMRISTGAFKSTPVKNLNILCNEPELKLRRNDLMLRPWILFPAEVSFTKPCI